MKEVVANHGQTKIIINGKWASMSAEQIASDFRCGLQDQSAYCLAIQSAIIEAKEQVVRVS